MAAEFYAGFSNSLSQSIRAVLMSRKVICYLRVNDDECRVDIFSTNTEIFKKCGFEIPAQGELLVGHIHSSDRKRARELCQNCQYISGLMCIYRDTGLTFKTNLLLEQEEIQHDEIIERYAKLPKSRWRINQELREFL